MRAPTKDWRRRGGAESLKKDGKKGGSDDGFVDRCAVSARCLNDTRWGTGLVERDWVMVWLEDHAWVGTLELLLEF